MKFSIIIPVYNTEEYIKECLKSVKKQTFKNYEVIIVNDGSTDNSKETIEKLIKNNSNFNLYTKENEGLSSARNYGVKKAKGEYLIFLDSDDYIDTSLLEVINNYIEENKKVELIRYEVIKVENNKENKCIFNEIEDGTGQEVFINLCKNELFMTAWSYAYKRSMWIKHNYEFTKGRFHEDYGLIPYIVINSKYIGFTNYYGYYYRIRENSITTNTKKVDKRYNDIFYFYDNLMKKINKDIAITNKGRKVFKSYLANSLIVLLSTMDKNMFNKYYPKVKKRRVSKHLIVTNIKQLIKKIMVSISLKLYLKIFK